MIAHSFSVMYDQQSEEHVTCDLCGHTFPKWSVQRLPRHDLEPLVHLVVVHGAPRCNFLYPGTWPEDEDRGMPCYLPAGHSQWHKCEGRQGKFGRVWSSDGRGTR